MRDMKLQMKYKMKYIAISILIWLDLMGILGFVLLNLVPFNNRIVKAICLVISIAAIIFLAINLNPLEDIRFKYLIRMMEMEKES